MSVELELLLLLLLLFLSGRLLFLRERNAQCHVARLMDGFCFTLTCARPSLLPLGQFAVACISYEGQTTNLRGARKQAAREEIVARRIQI